MKNQYFGDFGDYQKFSLLKILRDVGGLKIAVHWMKTADDLSSDGNKIKYLENVGVWRKYDEGVFDFLKGHVAARRRDLRLYERSSHASGIRFINDHIEDPSRRLAMLVAIAKDKESDLIFFDPDNGIEVASTNKKTLHKYVLWSDMEAALSSGKSVLVYQHFSRQNREAFIKGKKQELQKRFPKAEVVSVRVRNSVYFFLCREKDLASIRKALGSYAAIWREHTAVS